MPKLKKYFLVFLVLALSIMFSGCGLRGFVKQRQKDIENFGATTRTGQGRY